MERTRLHGIGEPVTLRSLSGDIDSGKALDIMAELGVKAFREWVNLTALLENPDTLRPEAVAEYTKTFDRCRELDIEVTGAMHGWFLPEACHCTDRCALPERDLTPGSLYMQTMEMLERSWYTLVSVFPQVPQWETGNENNIDIFVHPIGWEFGQDPAVQPTYDFHTKLLMTCDIMYFSARGIRRANPEAKVVSFSPTPSTRGTGLPYFVPGQYAIALSLEEMYKIIEAGESFSKNPDDYFDMVAWHPYLGTQMGYDRVYADYPATEDYYPDEHADGRWKAFSDAAYQVMVRHGEGHKKVLITEFGFSDVGDPEREKLQAGLVRETFRQLEDMPYIHTMHFFRLFTSVKADASAADAFKNENEHYFGIVTEDYVLRERAKALKEIYTK